MFAHHADNGYSSWNVLGQLRNLIYVPVPYLKAIALRGYRIGSFSKRSLKNVIDSQALGPVFLFRRDRDKRL